MSTSKAINEQDDPEENPNLIKKVQHILKDIERLNQERIAIETEKNTALISCAQFQRDYDMLSIALKDMQRKVDLLDQKLEPEKVPQKILIASGKSPQIIYADEELEQEMRKEGTEENQNRPIMTASNRRVIFSETPVQWQCRKTAIQPIEKKPKLKQSIFVNTRVYYAAYDDKTGRLFFFDGMSVTSLNISTKELIISSRIPLLTDPKANVFCEMFRDYSVMAVSNGRNKLLFYMVEENEWVIPKKETTAPITCMSLSHDEGRLFAGTRDGHFLAWDTRSLEPVSDLILIGAPISGVVENAIHTYVFVSYFNGTVVQYVPNSDVADVVYANRGTPIMGITRDTKNGTIVILTMSGEATYLSFRDGALIPIASLVHHKKPVSALQFCPGADMCISGADDGLAVIWDTSSFEVMFEIAAHTAPIPYVSVCKRERTFVTCSADGYINMWEYFV